MERSLFDDLFAQAIGQEALRYFKSQQLLDQVRYTMELNAMLILTQIKLILNDDTLDDPECFQRIDAIVELFYEKGLNTSRHSQEQLK